MSASPYPRFDGVPTIYSAPTAAMVGACETVCIITRHMRATGAW